MRRRSLPGSYVALSVTDNGPGVPEDVLPHIFEPFFTTKSDGRRHGARPLDRLRHRGAERRRHGSLDAAVRRRALHDLPAGAAGGPIEAGAVELPARARVPCGTETILLVEDEEPVRELVRRVLEDVGYVVLAAALPSEAERLLEETADIDLLLTDVVMPEMSGYDLALRVTRAPP